MPYKPFEISLMPPKGSLKLFDIRKSFKLQSFFRLHKICYSLVDSLIKHLLNKILGGRGVGSGNEVVLKIIKIYEATGGCLWLRLLGFISVKKEKF